MRRYLDVLQRIVRRRSCAAEEQVTQSPLESDVQERYRGCRYRLVAQNSWNVHESVSPCGRSNVM